MTPTAPHADVPREDGSPIEPRIVNGLTVRPREKVNLWYVGFFFSPDIVLLFIGIGLGVHRLMRFLDKNWQLDETSKPEGARLK